MIKNALISVSNKNKVINFACELNKLGIKLLATSGTAKILSTVDLPVLEISKYIDFPEILNGRVKSLHPKVHGGILAKRNLSHMNFLAVNNILPIDLVVVDLYPFTEVISNKNSTLSDIIDNIDIGGLAIIRSAAKNYQYVTVLVDINDYELVLNELYENNQIHYLTNLKLATKAFKYTAQYDNMIAGYLTTIKNNSNTQKDVIYPDLLNLTFKKKENLIYGENPHQTAALYKENTIPSNKLDYLVNYSQIQGKRLSFNNLNDADIAWKCVNSLPTHSRNVVGCAIVKHANPCGVAQSTSTLKAYEKAFTTDPKSAFGGVIAFNIEVDTITAQAIIKHFVELIIAPNFSEGAKNIFTSKKNTRLITVALKNIDTTIPEIDLKCIDGGLLVQNYNIKNIFLQKMSVVTKRYPNQKEIENLTFAWQIVKFVKSNAIVFCNKNMTLGIGAGQMSRVDSVNIAIMKAKQVGLSLTNSVVASDAFFPFRDSLDLIGNVGASCVIQPGGSKKDLELIQTANEYNIAMILTGKRHFSH